MEFAGWGHERRGNARQEERREIIRKLPLTTSDLPDGPPVGILARLYDTRVLAGNRRQNANPRQAFWPARRSSQLLFGKGCNGMRNKENC
jgi:hypothetical protein